MSKTNTVVSEPQYPEHEKLHAVVDKSQAIGQFIDWLRDEKRAILCGPPHKHNDDCREDGGFIICEYEKGQRPMFAYRIETLLAEFFEIDLNKLEEEKQTMLDDIRARNEATAK